MKYLLDTNVCIHSLRARGNKLVKQRLGQVPVAQIGLCSIVVAELYLGAERSANPLREMALVDSFCAAFTSLPFDDSATRDYAAIRFAIESRGTPIGHNDYLIAAIALAHNLTLVTHNTGEFSRVPGLSLED